MPDGNIEIGGDCNDSDRRLILAKKKSMDGVDQNCDGSNFVC